MDIGVKSEKNTEPPLGLSIFLLIYVLRYSVIPLSLVIIRLLGGTIDDSFASILSFLNEKTVSIILKIESTNVLILFLFSSFIGIYIAVLFLQGKFYFLGKKKELTQKTYTIIKIFSVLYLFFAVVKIFSGFSGNGFNSIHNFVNIIISLLFNAALLMYLLKSNQVKKFFLIDDQS